MIRTARSLCAAILLALVAAGCASTQLVNSWRGTRYQGPPLTRVLVIGVTKQSAVRRVFEDAFVAELTRGQVSAVPSYTLIPEDGEVPKDRLAQAVAQSGADGVLITRLVRVDRQTRIDPGYMGPPMMGFYDYYPFAWGGFYDPPRIYSYDVVIWDTSVFEARSNQMLWAGATETVAPRDMSKDAKEAAGVVAKALRNSGVLPPK